MVDNKVASVFRKPNSNSQIEAEHSPNHRVPNEQPHLGGVWQVSVEVSDNQWDHCDSKNQQNWLSAPLPTLAKLVIPRGTSNSVQCVD